MDKCCLTFNEDVKDYDKWRPTYCKELLDNIIQYSELNENKKAIEVGIGTGQATMPFLMTGCDVTAIEFGKNLAEYSKEKFKGYKRISQTIQSHCFRELEVKLYHQTRTFNASDYISLLNTYSDHRNMEASIKQLFESEIKNAILENGNILIVCDTIDLYLARK